MEILQAGGLVAFPTETVYGLGADATDDRAVARIFEAKARPRFNPLIVHVLNIEQAQALVDFSPMARVLAEHFWPGPLTLVLPRKSGSPVSLLASAGLDTVAVRAPAHSIARTLLASLNRPIAAPSANRSGRLSPTTAQHVAEDFGDRIDLILDGGPTRHGLESTVIGFKERVPIVLRPGAISRDQIEALVGEVRSPSGPDIASPGQLESHYSPRAELRLNARTVEGGEALLAFGADEPQGATTVRNLSRSGDITEAAANLFAMLRELDRSAARRIAVVPIPHEGLGEAINDRLSRAAAPHGDT